jgi:hypothetical protein
MYTVTINQSGYLPEADPQTFDKWQDACDFVMDEMDRQADNVEDYHIAELWADLNHIFAVAKHGDPQVLEFQAPDGYCYCIYI